MKPEINKIYHGFNLLEEYEIKEIQSIARVFIHEKSGARLLHLENDDDNKVFSIGFRTPPSDSTGIPHIIEHSVLSGSRKYLTKEPFMDMAKGSLKTFLNAMTFPDKTVYPIASRNEKDFFNLMDVYLDAVFYPKIYEIPEILMQEGWHYELHDKNDDITYKGVVYNEMQGAYSSPERLLYQKIVESLYPDTCYQYSSGGDPDVIPELTYEAFLEFHRNFYHPTNSYIYLYGNGNIEKQLDFIDKNYLSNFDKINIDSHVEVQKPFERMKEVETYYPISEDENDENSTYLSLNFLLGESTDSEIYLMKSIINQLLIESSAAPLKKSLIDAGIGEDILAITSSGIQPSFSIVAKNTSLDKKEQFKEVVFSTLEKLVKEGIDKKLIEACINIAEYDLREASKYPTKGIMYNTTCLDSWLYDSHPTTHIQYEETIRNLRSKIETNYFEEFIEEHILNNNHSSLIIMKGKKGLGDEKRKALERKLSDYKNSLTDEEIETLIEKNTKLKEMQLSADTPEAKATIPNLLISDVEPKAKIIPQEIIKDKEVTILYHDIFTSKIAYVDFLFDISMADEELIPYVNLLTEIIGKVDTETMSYSQLSNEIYVNTGGIDLATEVYIENGNDKIYYPKLIIKGKTIGDKIIPFINLVTELITASKIEDEKRIKELIQRTKSRLEMDIFDMGHLVSSSRTASYFSPGEKYREILKGLDFYWFICDINNNFENNSEEILSNLRKAYDIIFNVNNLIVSFTGDKDDFRITRENLHFVTSKLNAGKLEPKHYKFIEAKLNEGILSSANVQYVSKGYNFNRFGHKYHGSMLVLSTILSSDYLHNRIRARGGAYGCGIMFERSGNVKTLSYRDPNLKETIDVYNNMADYIKNLDLDTDDLTKYIIGTISKLDYATTPHMESQIAVRNYICHVSQNDIQDERNEVLSTELSDIVSLSQLLDDLMKADYYCVLGSENKIKENESIFNKLVSLKK
jgi:Zn-dependent M16 (insulinase) family peptidase